MKIAILGTGAIGSAFAFQLSKAGHDVTAIARGEREKQLRADRAIVTVTGERAAVEVAGQLDVSKPYDLVLVTVLAPQVGAVLPALKESSAKKVMFMFNTFDSLEPLRDAVGAHRFLFGFPQGVLGRLIDGKLKFQLMPGSAVSDADWAKVFGEAGICCSVEPDMHSWLRSHAALVIPLMASAVRSLTKPISWAEAREYARAFDTGFSIVRELGHHVKPAYLSALSRLPTSIIAFSIWAMSRTATQRELGMLGPAEARMLIDMMSKAAPSRSQPLLAIRP